MMIEKRLDRIEGHLLQLIQMVAANSRAVGAMDQRMARLEQRMDGLEQRMDGLEQRMDGMEQWMDRIEQRIDFESTLKIMQQFRHVNADIRHLDVEKLK